MNPRRDGLERERGFFSQACRDGQFQRVAFAPGRQVGLRPTQPLQFLPNQPLRFGLPALAAQGAGVVLAQFVLHLLQLGPIRSDEIIRLQPFVAGRPDYEDLRGVVVWLEDKQEELVLLTNNFKLAASTIAAIYKERW